jgi:hypothetical protein
MPYLEDMASLFNSFMLMAVGYNTKYPTEKRDIYFYTKATNKRPNAG